MKEKEPIITVITVVRNAESSIEGCINSVLAQGIADLEYIIIDGQSTDGTLAIIRKYQRSVETLISEPDNGLYDAMNKGLKHANGRYIHFLNADDCYFNNEVLCSIIPELDESSVAYGQMLYIESDGSKRLQGSDFSWDAELRGSRVPQMALFVPRHCYAIVGDFDTSLKIAADYDMTLRLAKCFPVKYLPQPISIMHAGGVSYQRPDLAFKESMSVSRRHGRGFFGSWWDYLLKRLKWSVAHNLPPSFVRLLKGDLSCR